MSKSPRLGKIGFVVWLVAPVVIVGVLWTQMDRSRGKPNPAFAHRATAVSADTLPGSAPATLVQQPVRMVEPESLPQGFIIVVKDRAGLASPTSPIHLASSHNGWNPSDVEQKLTPRSDGRWQIVIPKPKLDSRLAFKFTRGNWDTVEISEELKDVENRLLPSVDASKLKAGEAPVIELEVANWADQRTKDAAAEASSPYRAVKVAGGRLQRLQVVGGGVSIARDLLVWLPPGYDDAANASTTYPVLYLNDGQNVFDAFPGVPAEWGADEAALEAIASGSLEPFIIVGIPNAGPARMSEYIWMGGVAPDGVTPRGDAYVDFLAREVAPRVERTFRVRKGPEHTAIGGSSLGGLISLYAGFKRPDVFGAVLAESPSLRLRGKDIWKDAFDGFEKGPRLIVLGMGTRELGDDATRQAENGAIVETFKAFAADVERRGLAGRVQSVVDEGAGHNEKAWGKRLPAALRTLFGK